MTEDEFRENKKFTEELQAFLSTDTGRAFISVLRAENPLRKLAAAENNNKRTIRDSAIAEHGSAETLLGRATGWQMCEDIIDRCKQHITPAEKERKETTGSRAARVMRQESNTPEQNRQ